MNTVRPRIAMTQTRGAHTHTRSREFGRKEVPNVLERNGVSVLCLGYR